MKHVDTLIVGAGFAGIACALRLQREGRTSFAIIERADGIGGTWRDNTYPGVACDVPSHLYCLSGHPNPGWSGIYASGREIRNYLGDVARRAGLRSHIYTGHAMTDASWSASGWTIETGGSSPGWFHATNLIVACGRLSEPRVPDIGGLESFPGPMFHSARWDHSTPIANARVAVVGTGASAVQIVPQLVRRGASVTLFQRTPPWIVPRNDRAYTAPERDMFTADPRALADTRAALYDEGEARFAARSGDPRASEQAASLARAHLARSIGDDALRAALTPQYAFGCKRVLLSDDFYPAVASGAVTLEASALDRVDGRTLTAASGRTHEADVLVLATGFEAATQPYAALVRGEFGQSLNEHWDRGMTSVASTLVPGFPDLYVVNGPNASLGHNSALLMIEEQADLVARCLDARDLVGEPVRVSEEQESAYSREIDDRAADTPWVTGGCDNWYVDPRSGRLTLLWPGTVDAFRARLAGFDPTSLTRSPSEGYV